MARTDPEPMSDAKIVAKIRDLEHARDQARSQSNDAWDAYRRAEDHWRSQDYHSNFAGVCDNRDAYDTLERSKRKLDEHETLAKKADGLEEQIRGLEKQRRALRDKDDRGFFAGPPAAASNEARPPSDAEVPLSGSENYAGSHHYGDGPGKGVLVVAILAVVVLVGAYMAIVEIGKITWFVWPFAALAAGVVALTPGAQAVRARAALSRSAPHGRVALAVSACAIVGAIVVGEGALATARLQSSVLTAGPAASLWQIAPVCAAVGVVAATLRGRRSTS